MSTSTVLPLAFRCTKCYQLTCVSSDQVGNSVPCSSCSTLVIVPEATPDTIQAGEEYIAKSDSSPQPKIDLNEDLSEEEIFQMAWDAAQEHVRVNASPSSLVCSRWKRFFGAIIDTVAGIVAVMAGFIVAALLGAIGGEAGDPTLLVVVMTIPALLGICQCYLIAAEGRTVGKYCVKSKIVDINGNPPGFFQGIVMRIFVVGFLGIIPLFSLINILWIFNEPKRCLHDCIAGTYVTDA